MNSDKHLIIKLVIFSVFDGKLKVFLLKETLPVEELEKGKSLDDIAKELFTTSLRIPFKDFYFEQLYTFSKEAEVAIVYYALVPYFLLPKTSLKYWRNCRRLGEKIPDLDIIDYAIKRLCWKIEYTNIVYSLLPHEFIFSDLQTTYEAILDKSLDKRNFRKKMLSLNILKQTGRMKNLGRARPGELFSFKKRQLTFVEIL